MAEYKLSLVALASITAKTLGLKVPHTLLARADEIIELITGQWQLPAHIAMVRCDATFLPLLNEVQPELAQGRDSGIADKRSYCFSA